MHRIILDLGSGNSCKNNLETVYKIIDSIPNDPRIVIKWQLFQKAGNNIPLERKIFTEAYTYAKNKGFLTTSSVFDLPSLNFLLTFKALPFIKISNNPKYYDLIEKIPRETPVYVSWNGQGHKPSGDVVMSCISKYPAQQSDYYKAFSNPEMEYALSDHTIGIELAIKMNPRYYETHYKIFGATGLDAGAFAKYPHDIKNLIELR
jgi:sialic acid synthase SpsE